jgi:TPR repeat protein
MPTFNELPDLKSQAARGSASAAIDLSLWYMKFPDGRDTQQYWATIAAENGSSAGQQRLGELLLMDKSDPLSQVRARFWLERSAAQGNSLAKRRLEMMKTGASPN